MMVSCGNAGKIAVEGKVPSAVYRKGEGINSILCQFCKCWLHSRRSGIRGKLKEGSKYKRQTCANQQTDIAEDCPDTELNDQSLEIMEKFVIMVTQ